MKDQFKRTINYMRISLTKDCNYSCTFCKNNDIQQEKSLSYEQIFSIVKTAVELGIHRFKITGGEPLLRKDVVSFILQLKQTQGVEQVTLTTNGSLLSFNDIKQLQILDSITFSLNTLDLKKYQQLTKSDYFQKVVDNILYAVSLKMKVKINCVLYNGISNQDILDLMMFANKHHIILRFIELMPMKNKIDVDTYTKKDILAVANNHGFNLQSTKLQLGNGPAHYYRMDQTYIGFIEPIHGKFCHKCNRIRLTSSGFLKACLFHLTGYDLKKFIDDQYLLKEVMKDVIYNKPAAHDFEMKSAGIGMNEIGG